MSDLRFRIKAQSESAAKTIVKARNFTITIDEPQDLGGTDTAPNPVEFVLASLAGCLNVLAHLVAKEMNIQLSGVEIDISGNLNPDRLFGISKNDRAGYKDISVRIKPLDCAANEETLEKWLKEVTDRCPVSDNLKNTTPVNVTLRIC